MADQFKLKAFVRIDGTGKVIPGGPIFQASKPKVGKWREINVKECCNYVPGSTTTTTSTSTSTSTSTTTTAAPTTTTTTTTAAPIDCIVDVYNITDGVCTTLLASNYNITTSTPVIVGKWYTPSSLIAYNIISLGGSGGAFEVLTNERDTCNTFSGDVFWSDISCSDSAGLIQVTGNGTTFCDSTVLTSSSFEGFSVGSHFITTAMSGQTYTVSTNGSIFATVTSACTAC